MKFKLDTSFEEVESNKKYIAAIGFKDRFGYVNSEGTLHVCIPITAEHHTRGYLFDDIIVEARFTINKQRVEDLIDIISKYNLRK